MERPSSLAQDVDAKAAAVPLTFEALFADQHERLYRALYLIVGNTGEAEELMQDAFLRSRILSTGLFELRRVRLHAGRHHAQVHIRVLEGDRWVSVEASPKPYQSWRKHFSKETPAQGRALARLVEALLAEPAAWLPTTAWADSEIKAFVPSRYWFAYERSAPDMSKLPSPARELLQRAFFHACSVVTTGEARALLQALVEAGISPSDNQAYGIGFDLSGVSGPSYLHFHPALPDMKTC